METYTGQKGTGLILFGISRNARPSKTLFGVPRNVRPSLILLGVPRNVRFSLILFGVPRNVRPTLFFFARSNWVGNTQATLVTMVAWENPRRQRNHAGESSVFTSSPRRTGARQPTLAKFIGPRQQWRHWQHSQRSQSTERARIYCYAMPAFPNLLLHR